VTQAPAVPLAALSRRSRDETERIAAVFPREKRRDVAPRLLVGWLSLTHEATNERRMADRTRLAR